MRISDWSSDVCSSDLGTARIERGDDAGLARIQRVLRLPRGIHALGAILRGHQILDLELLLGDQREQLVGRLLGLERSLRALALRRERGERRRVGGDVRSEEHTSELKSLMRSSYSVFFLK